MESTNKKCTAVAAVATAAALVLTGTFAWVMENDQTELNKFTAKDPGTYKVELKEDFDPNDPWANKDVWVENKGDNPVIVRVRLEEFYDLEYRNGTTYNIKEGYSQGSDNGSAIFNVPGGSELDENKLADSSTGIDKYIKLQFGEDVVTMADWGTLNNNLSAAKKELKNAQTASNEAAIAEARAKVTAADDAIKAVSWVIDTDGWCYYTKALLYGEKTSYLLDDVDFNEDLFLESHSKPYNLDYKINVRLQAISADLEDFGSHLNDMQWTNVAHLDAEGNEVTDNAGRVIIEDNRSDNYEILADSTITNNAMALVTGIAYPYATPYTEGFKNADGSVAKRVSTANQLFQAVYFGNYHSILLTKDIEVTLGDSSIYGFPYLAMYESQNAGNKMIDLGGYKIKVKNNSGHNTMLFFSDMANKLSIKHGDIELEDTISLYGSEYKAGSLELVGVNVTGGKNLVDDTNLLGSGSDIKIYGSDIVTSAHAMPVNSNTSILLSSSKVTSLTSGVIIPNGYVENVNITLESPDTDHKTVITSNGTSGTDNFGIFLQKGWTLNAKDSTIEGSRYGITENYNLTPGDVYLENCTIRSNIGYYKVGDSKLTIKNSEIIAAGLVTEDDPESGYTAAGLVIRSGDVTLDNVNVKTSQGTFPSSDFIWTYEDVKNMYNSESGTNGPRRANFEAMQILLNNYDSINLNIIGGSYTATYQGHDKYNVPIEMRSIYVQDCTYSIHGTDGYDYNNTITISGNPTFTPKTTAFDTDYANTTINK